MAGGPYRSRGTGGVSDADLTAIAALTGTGIPARTTDDTWALRTLTEPAAGITVTNPAGVAGNPTLVLAHDLAALEGLSSTGIAVRSASNTWVQRSVAVSVPATITNGDGVSGNPTVTVRAASATDTGYLAAADYSKLQTFAHGTKSLDIQLETGTYGGTSAPTASSLGGARSRKWSGDSDGTCRYETGPLPGRTGGDVVFRIYYALGTSGTAGKEVVFKLSAQAFTTGDSLPASVLSNAQTVYTDVSAISSKVVSVIDITVAEAVFDQNKALMFFFLERLASTDARDDLAESDSTFHNIGIRLIYTGYGGIAAPTAP